MVERDLTARAHKLPLPAAGRFLNRLPRGWKLLIGFGVLVMVLISAVFSHRLAPYDPLTQDIMHRLQPPSFLGGPAGHLLGTDQLGRDVLSRVIYGSRISLAVGILGVLVAGSIGALVGMLSGFHGGKLDMLIMRVVDLQLSIPFLVLAVAVVTVLGPGLLNVVLVLAISSWVTYARVARGQALSVRQREFVEAARALGASNARLVARYLFPNIVPPTVVVATLEVGRLILAEASLSFLGLGIQPPTPTWGGISADGRDYLATSWWIATFPGLAILATVLAINFVGDWLRDALDPTLRR